MAATATAAAASPSFAAKLRERVKWFVFARRLSLEEPFNRAFDRRHRVETSSEAQLVDVGVAQGDAARGNSVYRCVWGSVFRRAVKAAAIDPARFTFVDFGAGKGKAMFLAADYPFARIVGVEYASGLYEAMKKNIAAYHNPNRKCARIEAILGDARTFDLPEGPVFCHFFNPFDDETMQVVLGRLAAHAGQQNAEVYVAFLNMRDVRENMLALAHPAFDMLAKARQFVIMRASTPNAPR